MATTRKVTVRICELPYTITTDEPESYVLELAKQIDTQMREMMQNNLQVSNSMAAVLLHGLSVQKS